MMRIGIDASRANAQVKTGTEWYSYDLLHALAAVDEETQFLLYTNTPLEEGLRHLGGNFRERLLRWPPRRLWTQLRLSWEMVLHAPDVLFVPAHTLPLYHPSAAVVTLHDIGFERFPKLYSRKEILYHHWTTAFALRSASRVIVPSHFTKEEILARYPHAQSERIVAIHHGFSPKRFHHIEDREDIGSKLQRFGIQQPYVLYIGRLQEKKNTPLLAEAFLRWCESHRHDSLRLVLAGKPDFGFSIVAKKIAHHPLRDRIIVTGYLPQGDLPYLMNGARAFVFPSLYEGFGLPVLEAQSCGIPVLTSATSSLPEVAGKGALLIDPTSVDALVQGLDRIVNDESLRTTLRQEGFINLKRFSWDRCARTTRDVLVTAATALR